ncbi:hypothetical protein LXA43DRAFT_905154 [Ganoderma leucocontextum]|nr:hypothetical protein LXA43DRAFT_905154 [Ganoderma leucocontextum]
MFTLTNWRLTCKTNYHQCSAALRRSLLTLLQPFVPFPSVIVDIIRENHCLLGGEFALSFLLRDPTYKPADLEIYTSDFEFEAVCDAILGDLNIRTQIRAYERSTTTTFATLLRLIAQTLSIRLLNGRSIYIHRSYTTSAAAPLSRTPCTALSNFVTAYGFGCSHPSLTLQRRGLLADQETPFLSDVDSSIMDNLRAHRFSLAASPAAWPEYRCSFIPRDLDDPSDLVPVESAILKPDASTTADDCWRHQYICPSQGRYFSDRGSFVDFFDPLGGDEAMCVDNNIAPFGPMVVWRLMSTFECDEGCGFYDDVLEEGVTSIPVLFKKDPYGELRDIVSDRYMGEHGRERTWGRRRSHSM